MALSEGKGLKVIQRPGPEVFRVIDDGSCVLTTLEPYKALRALKDVMDKHDVNVCWVDFERIQ